jgi:Protein of unknown function (DUF3999)
MSRTEAIRRTGSGHWIAALILLGLGQDLLRPGPGAAAAEPAGRESLSGWRYLQELSLPAPTDATARLDDFVLSPDVFDGARADLGDLRLYDPSGKEVPYALRVRRPDFRAEAIPASEFNRSKAPGGASEVALDLGESAVEHNDVQVEMPGANYRRHAQLDGSGDGKDWRALAEKDLIHFKAGTQVVDDRQFLYPPSRFRYLRVRLERDPKVDDEPVEIAALVVRRKVEVSGEFRDQTVPIGPHEPVRTDSGPGSAWVFELGGERVPCERLTLDVADPEFVRNYQIEAGGAASEPDQPFARVGDGLWRRRAGDPRKPLVAEFTEVTASRLRLIVIDDRNPPLELHAATCRAAAREVVFTAPARNVSGLRLYYGNPRAEPPRYDFARNLPATLDPPPTRLSLGSRSENPAYRPEPKPFTERWPWVIYVILGAICLALGAIIISLAQTAIRLHDERPAPAPVEGA